MSQQKSCADCKHYLQHYIVKRKRTIPTNCGHCTQQYRNGKYRKPDKLCEKFIEREKEIT